MPLRFRYVLWLRFGCVWLLQPQLRSAGMHSLYAVFLHFAFAYVFTAAWFWYYAGGVLSFYSSLFCKAFIDESITNEV